MAPLPENNTPRFFVDYSVNGIEHTAQVRFSGATSPSAFGSTLNAFLNTVGPLIYQMLISQIRFQAAGTTFSNPVTTGIEGNTYGSGAPADNQTAQWLNFVGRSTGGRRVTFGLYGLKAIDDFYRLNSGESSDLAAAVGILNGEATLWSAIDGIKAIWKPYANTGNNAYWQRKLRG